MRGERGDQPRHGPGEAAEAFLPFRRRTGCRRLEVARSRRGSAGAALRRAPAECPARQAQAEGLAAGMRIDDPAREYRQSRLEFGARRIGEVEDRHRLGGAAEFLDQQFAGARVGFPRDVPRRIAGVVVLQSREIVLAAAHGCRRPRAPGDSGGGGASRRGLRIDQAGEARMQHRPGTEQSVGKPRRDLDAIEHDVAASPRRHAERRRSPRRRPRRSTGRRAARRRRLQVAARRARPDSRARGGTRRPDRRMAVRCPRRVRPALPDCGGRRASRRSRARRAGRSAPSPRLFA